MFRALTFAGVEDTHILHATIEWCLYWQNEASLLNIKVYSIIHFVWNSTRRSSHVMYIPRRSKLLWPPAWKCVYCSYVREIKTGIRILKSSSLSPASLMAVVLKICFNTAFECSTGFRSGECIFRSKSSHLFPAHFLIYINDLLKNKLRSLVNVYDDDTRHYGHIS